MDLSRLQGVQYVRLASGAAEAIAPYIGVPLRPTDELVVTLAAWPEAIRPRPRQARDGRLIAGDPVLLGANDTGLLFEGTAASGRLRPVYVPWAEILDLQVVGATQRSA